MKKFILMMAAIVAAVSMSAQTYVAPKLTDNTYVTLRYGVTALMHPESNNFENFGHSLAQQTELQFGKWVTPRFAVALDGVVSWGTFSHQSVFSTPKYVGGVKQTYAVPFITVSALAKYRFVDTNKFAFTTVAGPGWVHGFVKNGQDANDLMAKFQLEFTYKLTDRLDVDVVPELNYNLTRNGANKQPYFDSHDAWYGLNVGITYRLGNKFQECPYTYTQGDVDHLNTVINELRAELEKKPTEVKVVETKVVKETVTVKDVNMLPTVTFEKGSAVVNNIDALASALKNSDGTITLVGSTSPEGTEKYNANLAVARAEAVKNALVNAGVSENRIKTATSYESQRAVQVLLSK